MKLPLLFLGLIATSGATYAGQVCKNGSIAASAPTAQYVMNDDGTVIDAASGLQWMLCSIGQTYINGECSGNASEHSWSEAVETANAFNSAGGVAGYADWRLPNIKELSSIIEWQCHTPAINLDIFSNTPPSSYWSSTARFDSAGGIEATKAYMVDFETGSNVVDGLAINRMVRLVRQP